MLNPQSRSLRVLTWLMLPMAAATSARAAGWSDNFNDGSVQDGSPVTWSQNPLGFFPGNYDPSSGDYALSAPGGGNSNQLVTWVDATDFTEVHIRAQGVILPAPGGQGGGNLALLGRLNANIVSGYILYLDDGGQLGLQMSPGGGAALIDLVPPVSLGALNGATDVVLEFSIVGNQLSGYAWRPGDAKPANPQISSTDVTFTSGKAGIAFDEDDDSTTGVFRFASAQDTAIGVSSWRLDAGGNWSLDGNWIGGRPNDSAAVANLGPAITAARTVTVDLPSSVGAINFDSASGYTIAGPAALTIGGGGAVNVINGSHAISAPLTLSGSTRFDVAFGSALTVTGQMTAALGSVLTKIGGGTLEVRHVRADGLTIDDGKVIVTANGGAEGTSVVTSLNVGAGALDLNNNDLVIKGGDVDQISNYVATGQLRSSSATEITALGVIRNGDRFTMFSGQEVLPDDVLVKYTWHGDADLSGVVDASDYVLADRGFLNGVGGWGNGDFNYDWRVNIADFFLMDRAFAMQGGAMAPGGVGAAAVPEPSAGMSVVAAAAAACLRRRSGRRSRATNKLEAD